MIQCEERKIPGDFSLLARRAILEPVPIRKPEHSYGEAHEKAPYGQGIEAMRMRHALNGFDYRTSEVEQVIEWRCGGKPRLFELKGIVEAVRLHCQAIGLADLPPLTRLERRSYGIMIMYIQRNWGYFSGILRNLTLIDGENKPITGGYVAEIPNVGFHAPKPVVTVAAGNA